MSYSLGVARYPVRLKRAAQSRLKVSPLERHSARSRRFRGVSFKIRSHIDGGGTTCAVERQAVSTSAIQSFISATAASSDGAMPGEAAARLVIK
jgi:hypothetical protein